MFITRTGPRDTSETSPSVSLTLEIFAAVSIRAVCLSVCLSVCLCLSLPPSLSVSVHISLIRGILLRQLKQTGQGKWHRYSMKSRSNIRGEDRAGWGTEARGRVYRKCRHPDRVTRSRRHSPLLGAAKRISEAIGVINTHRPRLTRHVRLYSKTPRSNHGHSLSTAVVRANRSSSAGLPIGPELAKDSGDCGRHRGSGG